MRPRPARQRRFTLGGNGNEIVDMLATQSGVRHLIDGTGSFRANRLALDAAPRGDAPRGLLHTPGQARRRAWVGATAAHRARPMRDRRLLRCPTTTVGNQAGVSASPSRAPSV